LLFNSIDFAIFLPIIFILYWFIVPRNAASKNLLITLASYVFYGWWDWRFLSLIIFSTLVDYFVGINLGKAEKQGHRKFLLLISVFVNLGLLGFFKYYNFFLDNFVDAFSFLGVPINGNSLNIILPVGISFYTFQTMSYTIDVYRKKIEPTRNFLAFSAFVSFFPQLVAGPIERATNLLPQFYKVNKFNYSEAVDGLRQMLWGFFKKMVIADNCAVIANGIFDNPEAYPASTLVLGAFFFAFQIYGDFSGYSDIAIGTARLFGFNLMQNFAFPYFSRDIAEFWRRWHISLSSWFRDYVYIPLGGSRGGDGMKIRNTFVIFVVSGFWHGANWTFIVWGLLNAIYFLPLLLAKKNRSNLDVVAEGKFFPSVKEFLQILLTFSITLLAWVFFRAQNVEVAITYIGNIFSATLFSIPIVPDSLSQTLFTLILVAIFVVVEWIGRANKYAIEKMAFSYARPFRWAFYIIIVFAIIFIAGSSQTFIYFQF
jgi:D-alanyl-lipoteichoic acid acyltransferase DltB (MBOAT superfamily)